MKSLILIAPPAAGKGTVSNALVDKYGFVHLSTGDLLREAMQKGDDFGNQLKAIMQSGALVSDEIVIQLLKSKFQEIGNNKPFILDGFPRTLDQAKYMLNLFKEMNITSYEAVYLDIDYEKAMHRAVGRLTCPNCHQIYNKFESEMKPKVDGICDLCGSSLESRADDNEESFQKRFNSYMEYTKPVVDFFKDMHKLSVVDSSKNPETTLSEVEKILEA